MTSLCLVASSTYRRVFHLSYLWSFVRLWDHLIHLILQYDNKLQKRCHIYLHLYPLIRHPSNKQCLHVTVTVWSLMLNLWCYFINDEELSKKAAMFALTEDMLNCYQSIFLLRYPFSIKIIKKKNLFLLHLSISTKKSGQNRN